MGDNIQTSFPPMGDQGIPSGFVNMSGNRSPYTQAVPKQGAKSGAPDDTGGIRTSTMINHAQGPRLAPITRIYPDNEAEAKPQMRNVKIVPGRGGVDDFYVTRLRQSEAGKI